jgi:exodeoxyribonuclease VII large subunit
VEESGVNEQSQFSADEAGRVQSVTEFTRRVRELLKGGLPAGWVRGEISNLRMQASGHCYFSLKDAGAQLSCVLFRGDASRQSVALKDGLQVLVYGEIDVYEARGQYQLIVRAVVDHGLGRLQQQFEDLKRRLAAEGLFDANRKRPLPVAACSVGLITSATGAAVQDFIRILRRREWVGRLVILPAKVQGAGAAAEMADMLRTAQELGWFDLIVIGRGGGSIEDLWAFNEEVLVRAVAACPVPVISAVGHEIDYTLCDFAADVRAETPSAAAELISTQHLSCVERVLSAASAIEDIAASRIEHARQQLDHARSRLRLLSPKASLEQNQLRLDDLANRLASACRHAAQERREQLGAARARFSSASPERRVQLESHRLLALWKRLESTSPQSVLKRGFALVSDESGRPVPRAAGVATGQALTTEFADGKVRSRVE